MSQAQRIAADPAISAFVTANAGSGKTKTLIDRTARLLLAGAEPATILCVTYTKAAAAEMQRRLFDLMGGWSVTDDEGLRKVLADLEGRAAESFSSRELSRARTLFARALETPGGLKIQTIHAFCERVLRRFPLEAGVSPGFEVIDDGAAAAIAAEARAGVAELAMSGEFSAISEAYAAFSVALDFQSFQSMFAAFEAERDAIAAYVDHVGGLAGLPGAIFTACGLDAVEDAGEIEEAAVLPPALDPLRWYAAARALAQGSVTDVKCGQVYQQVAEAASRGEPMVDAVRALFFTGTGEPRKRLATKAIDPAICDWLAEEQDRMARALERARAARVASDTVRALTLAHVYAGLYDAAKTARGVLDFADLVGKTAALLRDGPAAAWVLYKLDGGVDHILLDEAQDTAPDQWAILRRLTGEFFAGEGRPSDRAAERTLFIVGDEKQSIYSFQGADPERLIAETEGYLSRIRGSGRRAERPVLGESWRSVEEVLKFVDTVFEPEAMRGGVMPGGGAAPRHTPMRIGERGCVDLWEPEREIKGEERDAWSDPLDAETATSANRRLAARIASEIAALVARGDAVFDKERRAWRPAGYGDVLILVRRRGALFEDILRALKQRDLPVAGADRLALSAHIAFDDLLALARFVLFPKDELTLAALLKSPLCDLDDASLYDLAIRRGKTPLWTVLDQRRDERPVWRDAHDLLSFALAEGRSRRPVDFYSRVLARLDGKGRSMRARFLTRLGAEAADALDEFVAQVMAAEGRGVRDLESLAQALAALDITVKREMDRGAGEVRVMTAHGAKGLEAPIVFLPEMTLSQTARGGPLLKTDDGGFLWCSSASADCEASARARELRKAREQAESTRLLYVALTRARDRLVLCGRISATARRENIGGWYAAAEAALSHSDLAAEVRELEAGDLKFRRYGPDPKPASGAAPSPAAAAPAPGWLFAPPSAEAKGPRFVSPTGLAERAEDAAASPLDKVAGLGRFRRGNLIHRLLQLLPDLPVEARAAAARALLSREPNLSDAQREEMARAALGVLDDPRFAAVFGPGSRAEVALAGRAEGLPADTPAAGRVDRLVVEQTRVMVVDFKTNRPSPGAIEDADPAYILQMAIYAAILAEAFPGRRIEAALVWTDGPKLMPVPDNLMARALAQLAAAP
jgi:ATP-dependent helicase/nuclease subunit A